MPSIDVFNIQGKKVNTLELSETVFGKEVNEALVHSVIVNYLANQRQGTQSTKTRSEVRGGGKKPWKQKGTGRARHGSVRSPIWMGGGIALGPKPRSYKYKMNKKEKQNAIKMILSDKVANNALIVLDELKLEEIKTKSIVNVMNNLKIAGRTLILLPEKDEVVLRSARNIEKMLVSNVDVLNVYELLNNKQVITTVDTIKKLEEVYA